VRLNPPFDLDLNPIDHFLTSINDLFEHVLHDVQDSDMVGIAIRNEVNQSDKPIGLSFRRKEQMSGDVLWSVLEKISQSNSRFNALDTLTIEVHAVRMPTGFGRVKTKGRPLPLMAHLKRSIIEVKAETNCLAHVLIIAIARITKGPNYSSYRKGYKIHPVVDNLLATTGINLENGGGIPEHERFQDHFDQYKIVVYTGLNCDSIIFEGQVETSERINLLYDTTRHYHEIGSLTDAMAKRFVCMACGKICSRDIMHTCDQTCSDCMASPPCVQAGVRIPCTDCNRHFRSQACFANHKVKEETRKVFVIVNASARHVINSLSPTENMNVASTFARHVKPTKRKSISAICSQCRTCCLQAMG
jgi:hypothetical protein